MEWFRVAGHDVRVQRRGSGPVVLFLPGFVGTASTTFGHQMAALAGECTVVGLDLPGMGDSPAPASLDLAGYADVAAGVLRELDAGAATLVGLSFGGAVAIALADRDAGLVRGLVLAGAYAGWAGSLAAEEVARRVAISTAVARASPEERVAMMGPSMFSPDVDPALAGPFLASVAAMPADGFLAMTHAVSVADLRDALPRISVPTLVVHGQRDVRATRDVANGLADAIPTARLVVLPGSGHISPVEAPEAFTGVVRSFLRQPPL